MIGLDTNVLVRYIAQDDAAQSPKASTLIESLTVDEPGYVTQVALVEVVWVLSSLYAADRDQRPVGQKPEPRQFRNAHYRIGILFRRRREDWAEGKIIRGL